jgi:glutamyl/glutaminyl-tRNA synthetase
MRNRFIPERAGSLGILPLRRTGAFAFPMAKSCRSWTNGLDRDKRKRVAISETSFVWRRDGVPAYQLAVVVDDATMQITEVVRGEDLLLSTFRQLLLYRALGLKQPAFFHTPLILDQDEKRLAKRDDSVTFRALRARGLTPEQLLRASARASLAQPQVQRAE